MTTELDDEPIGLDDERLNEWLEELKAEIEFEPLREFIDRLKVKQTIDATRVA